MKALTIRQPYATLVMLGVKPLEFRTRRTNYRGPLAIHAGRQLHSLSPEQFLASRDVLKAVGFEQPKDLPLGCLLGTVNLVDCFPCNDLLRVQAEATQHCGWSDLDMFAWVLRDPCEFDDPVPVAGALGLWTCPSWFLTGVHV